MKFAKPMALVAASIAALCAADLQSPKPAGLTTGVNPPALPCAPVDPKSYVIGPEDQLQVIVFEDHAFDVAGETVRPDGKIGIPLLGDLMVAGMTPEEAETDIAGHLHAQYMRNLPHVNVIVRQVNSRYVTIQGEVLRPGRYPLTRPTTVFEALVNAGGFKDFARQKDIPVLRGYKVIAKFNFKDAVDGKHPERNIELLPGDIIVVK